MFFPENPVFSTVKLKNENHLRVKCVKQKLFNMFQAGLGSQSRSEPELLEKKLGAGAGAAWKKSQEPEPLKN